MLYILHYIICLSIFLFYVDIYTYIHDVLLHQLVFDFSSDFVYLISQLYRRYGNLDPDLYLSLFFDSVQDEM